MGALYNQAQNELQERYDSEDDTAIVVTLPRMPQPEKLDIKSCEQFLLELFEQWMSPYIHPRTPLALLSEATKAVSLGVVTSVHGVGKIRGAFPFSKNFWFEIPEVFHAAEKLVISLVDPEKLAC